MSDCARGFGWWQAADGKWYPPGYRPDPASEPPNPDRSTIPPLEAAPEAGHAGATDGHAEPVPESPWPPVRRKPAFRLGSDLDRGVWMWLMVIGALALIALVILAVSQIPSGPKKGAARTAAIAQSVSATSVPSPRWSPPW